VRGERGERRERERVVGGRGTGGEERERVNDETRR